MRQIIDELLLSQAESLGLVLTASGIPHRIQRGNQGYAIWVEDDDQLRALRALDAYLEENKEPTGEPEEQPLIKNLSGVWVSIPLVAWHVAASYKLDAKFMVEPIGASAEHFVAGEWHRAITALTLHSGAGHVAGNAVGLGLFGTAVCSLVGTGVGWLMILLSGVLGNVLNAYLYGSRHLSIGASTAVFGAVGVLAAMQFFRRKKLKRQRARAWLALGAGFALLGFLSTGERTDVMAHVFGFLVGLVLGAAHALLRRRPLPALVQIACGVVAVGLLAGAWLVAATSV